MTLHDYLTTQPDLAGYITDGNDAGILAALAAQVGTVTGSVSRARFAMWAGGTGLRAAIQDHADNTSSPLRSIALTLLDFLRGGVAETLDLSDPANIAMLDAWKAAGAITQAQEDALIALAQRPQTRGERDGWPSVTIEQIAQALRG